MAAGERRQNGRMVTVGLWVWGVGMSLLYLAQFADKARALWRHLVGG